jgi:hypothetical protein
MRKSCAQVVYSLRAGLGKVALLTHSRIAAFTGMGTNGRLVTSLYAVVPQASAHRFPVINRSNLLVFPTIHRTNDKGNKENTSS